MTAGSPTATPDSPPARPDYIPESHWDGEKAAPRETFGQFVKDHVAFKAAEDSKRLTLPARPEDYELALPADFQPPAGIKYEIDAADPIYAQARTWAKANNLSNDAFKQGLALIAASKVSEAQTIETAKATELGKLGVNAEARVSALKTFFDAKGYGALSGMLVTEQIVRQAEKLMADMTGGGNFSQQHRETADPAGKIPGYEKMSFEQRRAAQDNATRQRAN